MTKNDNLLKVTRPTLKGTPQNKTTLFMLPALNLSGDKTGFRLLQYYGFINCYLDWKESPEAHQNCIYLVFNPTDAAMARFGEFYDIYKTYPNFVTDYVLDANLVILVFRVKDKWKETLQAFRNSKYSWMSKEYAELFKRPDLNTGRVFVQNEYYIITKDKDYKRKLEDSLSNPTSIVVIADHLELMDSLDPAKEIFSYEYTDTTPEILTGEG